MTKQNTSERKNLYSNFFDIIPMSLLVYIDCMKYDTVIHRFKYRIKCNIFLVKPLC